MSIISDKVEALTTVPDEWAAAIFDFQPKLLNRLTKLSSELTLTSEGLIEMTAQNLTRIEAIMADLKQFMTSGEYRSKVRSTIYSAAG